MASAPHVLCIFDAPSRESAVAAVARTIGLIKRRHALSCAEIARAIECSSDTIERAAREETQLTLDAAARLAHFFPDCSDKLRMLFDPAIGAKPATMEERVDRAQAELAAVRAELSEQRRESAA